jgi:phosphatidylserine synthase 2
MRERKASGKTAVDQPTSPVASSKKAVQTPTATPTGSGPVFRRPTPYVSEPDFVDCLYQPHTITAGVVLLSALLFIWHWYHLENDLVGSVKLGLVAAAWTFIVFGAIHLPDGLMVRPHPAVWRAVLATAIIYLVWTIFLLFQDLSTVKMIAALYDPRLKEPLPEQSYAEDCRLGTPEDPWKFVHTITDVFLLAHAAGYWAKTLVLRDWRLVTAVSIGFELLEVSLQHVLPNFKECWWDHVIADIIICNGGGTLLGMWTLHLMRAKKYHWVKLSEIRSLSGKAGRVLRQLGPRQFDAYQWHMFESPKRLMQVLLLLIVMFVQELNCFYLKNMLNQKPAYHLVILRLVGWALFALPGLREFYDYIADPQCKRLGSMAWVGAVTLIAETTLIVKMARQSGYFRQPTPSYVGIPWIVATALFAVWALLFYGAPRLRRYFVTRTLLNIIFWACPCVLLAMCLMGNVDLEIGKAEFEAFVAKYNLW